MRIVFMPILPLVESDYAYLGIKYFFERNYDITVLETHQLLYPGYKEKVNVDFINLDYIVTPVNFEELVHFTSRLSNNDVIFFYLASQSGVKLLNKLKISCEARFATYVSGSIPSTSSPCGVLNIVRRKIMPLLRKIQYKLGVNVFESDYYFTGAPKDELIYPWLAGKKTKHIKIHSRDYERCLDIEQYRHNKKYCVFLDTDILDASDYVISGRKFNHNTIIIYQKKLKDFFNWIQTNFNLDIIISAHPKSRIYKNMDTFHCYKILYNQSAELVKGSEFVINEGTTAISFGVYFNKPILFITMKELDFAYSTLCGFAKALKKDIFCVDTLNNKKLKRIENDLLNMGEYNNYKYNYLTYQDEVINNFKLIEDSIIMDIDEL